MFAVVGVAIVTHCSIIPLAASTMSGHFKVLKHAGLITAEWKATAVVYSLNVPAAEESVGVLMEICKVGHAPQPPRES